MHCLLESGDGKSLCILIVRTCVITVLITGVVSDLVEDTANFHFGQSVDGDDAREGVQPDEREKHAMVDGGQDAHRGQGRGRRFACVGVFGNVAVPARQELAHRALAKRLEAGDAIRG